ncbi:MAG: SGNH/GDSL hydrolase family protein, partial [Acidobacteriota bacterium]|nr:SGNH/GDSL hydrolase family protein [Acidobacteriota bacterium]
MSSITTPTPSRRRTKIFLLLASACLSLAVAEAALRVAGVSYPNFYQPDARRGWALYPGAEGWWRKEGLAYVRINSAGQRDDFEHPLTKAAGTLRIAVVGDSCVESLQVPLAQTFWKRLEGELGPSAARAGRRVEVLDFGVSGYGTAQELLTLRDEVWKYAPDLVLLAFYTGNDVRNNYRPLEQDPARPYFELDGDRLRLDDSFLSSSGYRLRRSAPARLLYAVFNHSRLLELAKQGKSRLDDQVGAMKARRVETGEALQELGLDNAVYSPPAETNWREAWRVTEAILLAMRDEAAAHHVPWGVVTLSTGIQVHPDPAVRTAFMRRLGVDTLFYPDVRISAFGAAHGFPVLNLAQPLRRLAERRRIFLHGFPNTAPGEGHWNSAGHRAAAALIAAWLCRPGAVALPA